MLLLMKSNEIHDLFCYFLKGMMSKNNFPTHKMSWYTRTFLLLMKSRGISELFLLPMKRNDELKQFRWS